MFDDFIEAPFINCKNESRKCSSSYHFLTRTINTGWPRSMNRLHEARKQFYTPGGQKTLRNNLVTNHLTCINAESPFQLCNSGFALCPTKHPAFSCNFTNAMFSFRKKTVASQMPCFHVAMQQKDVASCSMISLKRRSSTAKMNQENFHFHITSQQEESTQVGLEA